MLLQDFRGDVAWVHAREGHCGKAYWPGGQSGITLDPGADLGHISRSLFEEHYGPLLTPPQLQACREAYGLRGTRADARLEADARLHAIRISRSQAARLFPLVADPYWRGITNRFPALLHSRVPGVVHTVLLSLAYNRGVHNPGLETLEDPIRQRDWEALAEEIDAMQNDHVLEGITRRRDLEAAVVERWHRDYWQAMRDVTAALRADVLPPDPLPYRKPDPASL